MTHVTDAPRALTPPMALTLEQYRELAASDASVLLGRPLTDSERRIAVHVTDTMHAVMTNLIAHNKTLAARLQSCEDGDYGRDMGVVA